MMTIEAKCELFENLKDYLKKSVTNFGEDALTQKLQLYEDDSRFVIFNLRDDPDNPLIQLLFPRSNSTVSFLLESRRILKVRIGDTPFVELNRNKISQLDDETFQMLSVFFSWIASNN